ncbi:MAG: hypothetical protein ACLGG7_01450 [Bacteriovoracia bacterium]
MKFTLIMILGLFSLGAIATEQASQDVTREDCSGRVSSTEGVKADTATQTPATQSTGSQGASDQ